MPDVSRNVMSFRSCHIGKNQNLIVKKANLFRLAGVGEVYRGRKIVQPFNHFIMSPVIGQEGEVMAKAGRSDHEIEVADGFSFLPEFAPFLAEYLADTFVYPQGRELLRKVERTF